MKNRLISILKNGSYLEYAQGRFDHWCIYSVGEHYRYAIKDKDVFSLLKECVNKIPEKEIYSDFVNIYSQTTSGFNPDIVKQIKKISNKYRECQEQIEYILSFLYAGMVAEENKHKAILKKRIKRLAVHQLLIENQLPETTANFSRGKPWYWLDRECKNRGF